ncbi:MAG: protein kinase [Gemmatimonadetes bacterium]|nr:protein kinase [Gemmatimonadota bacterium]
MNCAVCQASLFAGDVFCVRCGTRVPAAVAAGEHSGQTRSMAAVASGAAPAAAACPGCHEPVAPDDRYCQRCGHALAGPVAAANAPLAPASACPTCQSPVFADDIFCVRCGTRVAPDVVSAAPASGSAPGASPAAEMGGGVVAPAPERPRPATRVLAAIGAGKSSITPPCPSCGAPTVVGDAFCQSCGHGLGPAEARAASLVCPGCGDSLFPDDTFCVGCGTRVGQAAPAAPGAGGRGGTRVMEALAAGRTTATPPCPHCGTAVVPGDAFCAACGTQVAERTSTPRFERPAGTGPAEAEVVIGRKDAADHAWDGVRKKLEEATLGEYEIIKEVGRGGMAAVFLAHDIALNRKVAIKVMAPGLLMGKGMVERFSREAQTVANLSHPNIIQIYTVRHAGDLHFFVMQFVAGNSLQAILETVGPLPLDIVRQVLYQVGSGLASAHKRGIVHRDVKPANILIDTDGTAVVMDFGIAKVAEDGGASHSGMTQAGTVVGTPAYMSPEQCYSAEVTWSADQYSLGVVGYEMLIGRPPFDGNPFEVMQAHTQDDPPRIRSQRADCPAAVENAILRMLRKRADDRFPTMAAALDALGAEPAPAGDPVHQEMAVLAQHETDPAKAGAPQTPRSPVPGVRRAVRRGRRRGVPTAAWVGGAVVVVAAVAGYFLTRDQTPAAPAGADSTVATAPAVITRIALSTRRDSVLVGATLALRLSAFDSAGAAVRGRPVLWTSADSTVASVSGQGEDAVVTGRRAGRTVVAAVVDGKQETAEVMVTAPRRSAVTVSAPKREILQGERLTLGAVLTDSLGKVDPAAVIEWKSANPAVAQIDRGGVVVARQAGRVRMTATAGRLSGFVDLVVRGPQAAAITLFSPGGQLTAGRTARVRIQVEWQGGVTGNPASATWRTSDASVAAIASSDSTGATVSLLKEGDVTVVAEMGAVRGTTGLQVRGAVAAALEVSRATVAFEAGPDDTPAPQTVSVTARGTDDPIAVGRVDFAGAGGWLTAQLQGGTLTLAATPKGLAPDTYRATVPLAAGGATRAVSVTLVVTAPGADAAAELARTRDELQALLDRYARALVAKDSAGIRSAYPGISARGLEDILKAKLADGYEIQLRRNAPIEPGSQPGTMVAEVSAGVLTGGGANFQRLQYTFARAGSGWRIVSVRPLR